MAKKTTSDVNVQRGRLITFEGSDHSGKTTQILLLEKALEERGIKSTKTREPGGTLVSEAIRDLIINPAFSEMTAQTEALLYEAARAQVVAEVIKPALERGDWVLCDRFTDSTTAYQSFGRGLPREEIEAANTWAAQGLEPDMTLVLFVKSSIAQKRGAERGEALDRIELENNAFHERVQKGYDQLVWEHPARMVRINANSSPGEVHKNVMHAIRARFWIEEEQ